VAAATLAAVLAPAAAPAAAARPITAAFYYAWYPETWKPTPHAMPSLHRYRSADTAVIRTHLRELRRARIDAAIVSWWGIHDRSDQRFRHLMQVARRLRSPERFAIYYEPEGQGDPSVARLQADIAHVLALARSPMYLRVGRKPVVFAFSTAADGCGMATRWKRAAAGRVYYVLKVFPGYRRCADQPSSWHQYAPVNAQVLVPGQSFTVSPGFFNAREPRARLARDITRFRRSVRAMNAAHVKWRLVTTFNEWGEGTAIEPGTAWGTAYIDALARRGLARARILRQQPLGVASVVVAAAARTALVTARIGTGARRQRVLARVEWGATTRYGHRTAWRVVRRTTGTRRVRFRIGPFAPDASIHLRVVVRRGHLRRASRDRLIDRRPPHVAAAGDVACGASSAGAACQQAATARLIEHGTYQAVLALGDLQYERGALADFQTFYNASWGAFLPGTFPAVGNHEYLTPHAAGYFAYFGARAGDPSRGYYSYDVGRWHLISLNSNCGQVGGCKAGSPQERWLRADLAAHPAACVLAYWHHPRFSSGGHGDNVSTQPLWKALADAHADVVLSGHDHDYERFAPVDGIRQFVVGTGGRNLTAFRKTPDAGSQVRILKFGVLDLQLASSSYTWRFRTVPNGEVLDSGTAACR
jgi:hypothetical protein